MDLAICMLVLLLGTTEVSGDVCSDESVYTQTVAVIGENVELPCSSAIHGLYVTSYSILWYKNSISFSTILRYTYPDRVYYWSAYRQSQYILVNTIEGLLTVHNVTLLNGGCYECRQSSLYKDVYDAVSIATSSDSVQSCIEQSYRHMTEINAREGERVVLQCPLYSEEYINYINVYWYDDTQQMLYHRLGSTSIAWYNDYSAVDFTFNTTDLSLTIPHMTSQYNACYRCRQEIRFITIYDAVILTVTADSSLTMIGQPTASELIDEGSTIVIECVTGEGNPAPQVTWTKDGSNLDTESEIFQNVEIAGSYNTSRMKSIITIQVTRSQNNKQYSCITESVSKMFTLLVRFLATSLTMSGTPAAGELVDEGSSIAIECVTDEGNPTPLVTWTKDGSNLDSESETFQNVEIAGLYDTNRIKSILRIQVTRSHNNKQYSCITDSVSKMFTLAVRFPATSLTMSGEPDVGEWTEQGSTVIVQCVTGESNPTAEVTWTRDEANLDSVTESVQNFVASGQYNSNIRRSVLTIQVHRSHHNTRFSCHTSGTSTSQFFTLAVRYGDHTLLLASSPESTSPIDEHSIISFTCTIDVNPPPNLTLWTHGKLEKLHEQRETTSLTLSLNSNRKYNKVGIFCEAVGGDLENALSSNELNFDVMFVPTTLNLTSSHPGLIDEGQQINLTCQSAEGNPTPDITWTLNGESIHTTPNLENMYNGQYNAKYYMSILTLTTNRHMDDTQYTCRVGSMYSVYQLQVTWPTEPAHSVTIEELSTHTATVSWIGGNSGGSQQIFIVQFKTLEESAYTNSPMIEDSGLGSKNYYGMSGLEANTVYSIQITSMNSYKSQSHRIESNVLTFKTQQSNTSVSTVSEAEGSSSNNLALIAGSVAAGMVVLVILSVVGTVLWCKCRNSLNQADNANTVPEDHHYYNNVTFNANQNKSVEPVQYEEVVLQLQSGTRNVTHGEVNTMPDTEQYDSITAYEVPEPPSQYTRLQGQRRKQNTQSPIYENVDNSPPYVNA